MTRFIKLRPGIFEHLQSGALGQREFIVLVRLIDLADAATGCWSGCAIALAKKCGPTFNESGMQKLMASLEKAGYINRFRTPAQRGNRPVGVNKYLCTTGPHAGMYLNLAKSGDEDSLCYEGIEEPDVPTDADDTEDDIHPGAETLAEVFKAAGLTVYASSLRTMSDFLERKSYNDDSIAQMERMLTWALADSFWGARIPRMENFINQLESDKAKGLPEQYFAVQKKLSKAKTIAPGGKSRQLSGLAAPNTPDAKPITTYGVRHQRTEFDDYESSFVPQGDGMRL